MIETKTCTTCGNAFSRASKAYNPSPAAWAKQRTCSPSCAAKARNAARPPVADEVFEDHVEEHPEAGCLDWIGTRTAAGYGQIRVGGRRVYAHRYAFARAHGRIPRGLFVLHRCDRPSCVREEHLFLGTQQDNVTDCIGKGRNSRGSAHPGAKLTEEIVLQGRRSGVSAAEFSRQHGVVPDVAAKALSGRSWRHVPMPGRVTGISCATV